MSSGLYSHTTRGTGTVLTAAIYNGDHQNHITNQNPSMTGAYSDNVTQMQLLTDPGGIGSESLASSLAGEIERLRFTIKGITGKTQWYAPPATTLESLAGGVFTSALTIATAAVAPLTLRRTENDTVERFAESFQRGSGAGADAEWRTTGDGANGVSQLALFLNNIEQIRFPLTRLLTTPQGYLSAHATQAHPTADVIAAGSVWYHPVQGNMAPLIAANGLMYYKPFSGILQLTLNNPNHALDLLYDVYLWDNAGTVVIGTGPAWTTSTVGSGSRGAAADLATLNGLLVNNLAITLRNGGTTFAAPLQTATYIGTILIDGTIAQITTHRAYGQSRRWSIFNAYNQKKQFLKAGDSTATWQYSVNAVRASNGNAANSMLVVLGQPNMISGIDIEFNQNVITTSNNGGNSNFINGIGFNSVVAFSGKTGRAGIPGEAEDIGHISNAVARHFTVPAIGVHRISCLEQTPTMNGSVDPSGGEAEMMLSATWMG